jgi:hypothetical protein
MANITNAQNQKFTVPDEAAPSYIERGFSEAGTTVELPADPPAVAKRTSTSRSSRSRKSTTKEKANVVPVGDNGDSGAPSTEAGSVQS